MKRQKAPKYEEALIIFFQSTGLDYIYINAITLGLVSIAFLISFWLPMPNRSMFFEGKKGVGSQPKKDRPCKENGPEAPVRAEDGSGVEEKKMEHDGSAGWCSRKNVATAAHLLWKSFRESYSSRHVIFLFLLTVITL